MNEMRRLINLVESAQHEHLDEGPVGKALATAALALGLNFGQQVQADQVYVYQDAQGELKATKNVMQIPDNTELSYVVDTDTEQIKYLKRPAGNKEQSAQRNLPQPVQDMMAGVKNVAKDPGSVTFKDFGVYTLSTGKKVYVGYYNAKNSMGGYGGHRIMMYAPEGTGSQFEQGQDMKLTWQPLGMSAMRLSGTTVMVPDISDNTSGGYPGYIDMDRPQDANYRLGLKFITTIWNDSLAMEKDIPKKYKNVLGKDPLWTPAKYTKLN
jgi:hypothetical protein